MATKNLEQAKGAYLKASQQYTESLISEITAKVNDAEGEYGLPSTDEDKIAYGDPVVTGRPVNIYITKKRKSLRVEVVTDEMEEDMDDLDVNSLPIESLETLLALLNRPLDDDDEDEYNDRP